MTKQMNDLSDKQMIQAESMWPGETLCLKKKPTGEEKAGVMGYSMFGVIVTSEEPISIYLQPDFAAVRTYDTIDELLADGWMVD